MMRHPNSPELLFGGIYKSNEDILKEISSVSNFYKLTTVSINELKSTTTAKDVKVENLKSYSAARANDGRLPNA